MLSGISLPHIILLLVIVVLVFGTGKLKNAGKDLGGFFKGFKDTDKPWTSWVKQPDLVYFSHMAVMKNNKTARCASCHGDKANSMTTAKIKGKMPMGQCMDCHTSLGISNACAVCHD